MSGPIERGALSGPLDGTASADNNGGVPFSAPLGGVYVKKRKKKSISGIRKALYRNFSVVPVRNFISGGGGRKDAPPGVDSCREAVGWAVRPMNSGRWVRQVRTGCMWLYLRSWVGYLLEFMMDLTDPTPLNF
ncbi:UNVERIFIED_CONTAM: protein phosphatase 2C 29 [Sesamum angustifolium]|uniref:Protein phosphatase 2C 29 n=1 Tax=Sesamum angustifolium TaxID=2727405 RepID=A0AAW2M541_9LAMI